MQQCLQSPLDRLSDSLSDVGLAIAAVKSRFVLLVGMARRSKPVTLLFGGNSLPTAYEHRFLGVVVDARINGVAHVRTTQPATKSPGNAIKRLCGTRRGSSPPALHNAVVVSRITYGLFYLQLPDDREMIPERLYRAGLKTALGVPRQSPTFEIFVETASLPIMNCTRNRPLRQLVRPNQRSPGDAV